MSNIVNFEENTKKIKLVAFDLDGVVNEGLVGYGEMAIPLMKQYNLKDFEAINELKKTFVVVVVSEDSNINYHLCRTKRIPFFCTKNKNDALKKAMLKYNVTPEEVVYVGNSFSDVENCKMIPFSLCPSDAIRSVLSVCHSVESFAGYGVIAEVYDLLKPEIKRRKALDK